MILILASCGVKKIRYASTTTKTQTQTPIQTPTQSTVPVQTLNKKKPPTSERTFVYDPALSTEERIAKYIQDFGPIAQKEMAEFRIPASITIAQGLLESGNGSGRLAREANNHFGIKCHSDWNGKRIYHDDDEKGECFRVYQNPMTSYRDHSLFLSERRRYAFLFDLSPTNYKAWAKGLKKAGYATDPKYPQKLISLIERYELDRWDKKVSLKKRTPVKPKQYVASGKEHQVQQGDTLYSIARQYTVPVDALIRLNKIKNNTIHPGQLLLVPKIK